MKILFMLSLILFSACTTTRTRETSSWSGAQRQETMEDDNYNQQQEQLRNQFPTPQRSF